MYKTMGIQGHTVVCDLEWIQSTQYSPRAEDLRSVLSMLLTVVLLAYLV